MTLTPPARMWALIFFTFTSALALGSGRATASEIEFLPLGSLPGGEGSSSVSDISGDGATVVGGAVSSQGNEAFRWTRDEGMVGLGDIPSTSFRSMALTVSTDGSVIVGEGTGDRGKTEAVVWRDGGAPESLGFLIGNSTYASAVGVSFDGGTVLGTTTLANRRYGPFIWTSALDMQPLDDVPSRYSSWAVALSEDGRTALVTDSTSRLWSEETGWVDIDASGDFQAKGMSADGSMIVGSVPATCPSGSGVCTEAAMWSAEESIVGLGWAEDPTDPDPQAVAVDVSRDGRVVVGYQGDRALIWDEESGMRDFVQVMLDDGVDLSNWLVLEPVAISDDGRVVVGTGTHVGGHEEAWLAVLPSAPEPVSALRVALLQPGHSLRHRSIRHARVSVVLFGTADFDVRDVDVETLTFGPDEATPILDQSRRHRRGHRHGRDRAVRDVDRDRRDRAVRDVDRDGYDDLISHYRASETGLEISMETDAEGVCLRGETSDGEPFEGCLDSRLEALCGYGYELAMLVPVIVWIRRRRPVEV